MQIEPNPYEASLTPLGSRADVAPEVNALDAFARYSGAKGMTLIALASGLWIACLVGMFVVPIFYWGDMWISFALVVGGNFLASALAITGGFKCQILAEEVSAKPVVVTGTALLLFRFFLDVCIFIVPDPDSKTYFLFATFILGALNLCLISWFTRKLARRLNRSSFVGHSSVALCCGVICVLCAISLLLSAIFAKAFQYVHLGSLFLLLTIAAFAAWGGFVIAGVLQIVVLGNLSRLLSRGERPPRYASWDK